MNKNILDEIYNTKILENEKLKKKSIKNFKGGNFFNALESKNFSIIAEFKRHSPSKGWINKEVDIKEQLLNYQNRQSVHAVSVLTDSVYFKGSLEDIESAKNLKNFSLPILRKDFIIDEMQIVESKKAKVDAILLIVRMLTKEQLFDFYALACSLNLDVIFETHTEEEIDLASQIGAKIIGINGRDLNTFEESLENVVNLKKVIPQNVISIAESCIRSQNDLEQIIEVGFDAALIGEALMKGLF